MGLGRLWAVRGSGIRHDADVDVADLAVKVGTGALGGATASLSADLDVWRSDTFDDAYLSRAVRQRPLHLQQPLALRAERIPAEHDSSTEQLQAEVTSPP